MSEDAVHIQSADYANRITKWWWHTPNEGDLPVQYRVKLKRRGVKTGIPDLVSPFLMLAIEFKREPGMDPTPEQDEWLAHFASIGWVTGCVGSFEEAKVLIDLAVVRAKKLQAAMKEWIILWGLQQANS